MNELPTTSADAFPYPNSQYSSAQSIGQANYSDDLQTTELGENGNFAAPDDSCFGTEPKSTEPVQTNGNSETKESWSHSTEDQCNDLGQPSDLGQHPTELGHENELLYQNDMSMRNSQTSSTVVPQSYANSNFPRTSGYLGGYDYGGWYFDFISIPIDSVLFFNF